MSIWVIALNIPPTCGTEVPLPDEATETFPDGLLVDDS